MATYEAQYFRCASILEQPQCHPRTHGVCLTKIRHDLHDKNATLIEFWKSWALANMELRSPSYHMLQIASQWASVMFSNTLL